MSLAKYGQKITLCQAEEILELMYMLAEISLDILEKEQETQRLKDSNANA